MAKDTRDWSRARIIESDPVPGFYKVRLQPFCPWVSARVWLDVPLDDDGRLADRPRRLVCQVNGEWASVHEFWERMVALPREEYDWLEAHPPADPLARTVRGQGYDHQSAGHA